MANKERDMSWLIKNYMHFFQKFGLTEESIRQQNKIWKTDKEDAGVAKYIIYLFKHLINQVNKYDIAGVKRHRLLQYFIFKPS